jgi:hypothetical protein
MVTVKSSQKIFTDSEVASLTGICVEHVHNFAKTRHLDQRRSMAIHPLRSDGSGDSVPEVHALRRLP